MDFFKDVETEEGTLINLDTYYDKYFNPESFDLENFEEKKLKKEFS